MTYISTKQGIFIFALFCWGIVSCNNTESDIGSSFFKSHAGAVTTDTLTVQVQTVYLDSVATNGSGIILLGAHEDSLSGNKKASSYMQLGAPEDQSIETTAIYDSLCFVLKPNQYAIGDTTKTFSFSVYPLQELIDPYENQTSLYNTSSFSSDATAIGEWSGRIYPTRTNKISVRLSDNFGLQLFSAIVNHSERLSTDDLFSLHFLKGILLKGKNNKAIFGFSANESSAFMRLYYHQKGDAKTVAYTDFKLTNSNLQFNHIDNDLSGTPFAALNSKNKTINAKTSNGISIMQPLSNLAIRLDFPHLQNLLHLSPYVKIVGGTILIYPESSTYSAANPLPSDLALCKITDYYTVLDSLTNSSGVAYGNLVTDYGYKESYYSYLLTNYITNEINKTNNNNKTKLLLVTPSPAYNTTFQQIVVDPSKIEISIGLVMYNAE